MALGTFTFIIDGARIGGGVESTARVQIQALQGVVVDDPANYVFLPHESALEPIGYSLPASFTLHTDIPTGSAAVSEAIGYKVRLVTDYGFDRTVEFPAHAAGSTVYYDDVLDQTFDGIGQEKALADLSYARRDAAWKADTTYLVGELVHNGGTQYRVTTAHTSGVSFDATKFSALSGGGTGGGAVDSVNGEVGVVTLDAADVGAVPTTRTIAGLDLSANRTAAAVKTALGLVKGDVGLGSVDNTADTAKPVSTAQQTALNLKADKNNAALTGTPTAPTAAPGTDTTQVATTEFVQQELGAATAVPAHAATHATGGDDELTLDVGQINGLGAALDAKGEAANRYWDPVGRTWTARPTVGANEVVRSWSTNDATASMPGGSVLGDVWIRHPDAPAV